MKNAAVLAALNAANKGHETEPAAAVIRRAIFAYIADCLGVPKGTPERTEAFQDWMSLPSSFGASANTLTEYSVREKGSRQAGGQYVE